MAYMAQPSFLMATDSSGHQFYSARPFTRNPLNEPAAAFTVSPKQAITSP